nr:cytochrome c3 family protein [Kofleriaceae bacterium]
MKALAVVVAIACARVAVAAPATGFDHNVHARDVAVSGADDVACARCHRGATGIVRPDHAACFGACHGAAPTAKTKLEPLCQTCHVDATKVFYPPYTVDRDFALQLGHATHTAAGAPCAGCHAPIVGGAKAAPHARCATCHDGKPGAAGAATTFAMTACARCHGPGIGNPEPPKLAFDPLPLQFAHDKHAARGAAKACTACHADVAATDSSLLPRPSTATCAAAGCHDGAAAFATTDACTRCHPRAPTSEWKVARGELRFVHGGSHQAAMAKPCASCHALAAGGEPLTPRHAACAGCHAPEFSARQPRICSACHNGSEPWRALGGDRPYPDATEFGATLDHGKHAGACASCHALTTASVQLRPPRGHAACTTAGCHAVATGPAPRMADCVVCHQLGLAASRAHDRETAAWSVRRHFEHASHAQTPCASCHTTMTSPDLRSLPTPPKATCAPCHDGRQAFKLTGTHCTRCHD